MKSFATTSIVSICTLLGAMPMAHGQDALIDHSFSVGAGANGAVNSILVQTDGKILVGGEFTVIASHTNSCLARLKSNGQIDASFAADTDGIVWRLLEQPDGKILVAGDFTVLHGVSRYHIGRLLTNGVVDPDFDAGASFADDDGIFTIALQPDGKILAASIGFIELDFSGFDYSRLVRLTDTGQTDNSFTNDNFFNYLIHALTVRTNGTIWVGGGFDRVNGITSPGLAVLDGNGQLDANASPVLVSGSDVYSFLDMTNGNTLLGGRLLRPNVISATTLAQMTPLGLWETNFQADKFAGSDGYQGTGYITSLLLQPDGKIVAGGHFYEVGGYWRRQIVRLDAQGRVDPCFDPGLGLIGFDWAQTVVRQPDGRILVGGRFPSTELNGPANIERLLPCGDCDATRVYLRNVPENNAFFVAGTYPPGGTNFLQLSTNLVDWVDMDTTTGSYLFHSFPASTISTTPAVFYRVKKAY